MRDENKTKTQLIDELKELRQQVGHFRQSDTSNIKSELPDTQNHLSVIFNNNNNPQILVKLEPDKTLRIIDVNDKYISTINKFGYNITKKDIIGISITEIILDILHFDEKVLNYTLNYYNKASKSGNIVWYEENFDFESDKYYSEVTMVPVMNDENMCTHILWTSHDITEKKKVEKARDEAFKIINTSPVVAFLWRNEEHWPVEYVTENIENVLGYSTDDLMSGKVKYSEIVHADDLDQVGQEVAKFSAKEKCEEFVHEPYRLVSKNGRVIWVEDRTYILRDGSGKISHYQGIILDISERKKAEMILRENEERVSSTFNAISDTVLLHPLSSEGFKPFVEVNDTACKRYGYTREEFMKLTAADITKQVDVQLHGKQKNRKKLEDTKKQIFETTHITKTGVEFPVEINSTIIEIGGRKVILSVVRDISERKETEIAMRENEEKYRSLFHNSIDSIFLHDDNGNIIDANKKSLELFGYKESEFELINISNLHPKSAKDTSKKAFEEIKQKGYVRFEVDFKKKSGKIFPADVSSTIIDIGGQKVVQGIVRDISERKQAEDSLKESEEKFRLYMENAHDGVLIVGEDSKFEFANEELSKILGYPIDEIVGQSFMYFLDKDSKILVYDRYERRQKGEDVPSRYEFKIVRKNGELRNVEISSAVTIDSKGRPKTIANLMDITDRNLAKQELTQNYYQLQAIYNSLPVIIWSLDEKGVFTLSEGKDLLALGLKPAQVVGESVFDLYKDNQLIIDETKKALKGEICEYESFVMDRIYYSVLIPFFDENNVVKGINGLSIDVTDKKNAEEELKRLRNYLSNIINSMPSVLVGVDNEGFVTQWNKTIERNTGIKADEAQGKLLSDVIPQMKSEMEKIKKSIQSRQVIQEQKRKDTVEKNASYEDMTIYPLITNGVEGAVIRIDDVTEKVRLEEMMIQSEKMLSVGGLAAGMAHEINNPLAGMMQTAEVMASRLKNNLLIKANVKAAEEVGTTMEVIEKFMHSRGIPRMINAINESGKRVAKIVDNMLTFSRKSEAAVSSHNLEEVLDKTLELASTDYDLKKHYDFKTIKIIKKYSGDLPTVFCESAKIQQVLLNIFRNGAQAMQTAAIKKPQFTIRTNHDLKRKMINVEIEDNGPGMDEEIRKRVFEPFFTTKTVGVGTGLGLSVSYFIIVENHHGELEVESRHGSGAKFIIRLPIGKTI